MLATASVSYAGKMASGAISAESKKITDLRVVDLKSELKRRNLDVAGVKNTLIARLKQAIEDEGGDPDNIEITASVDTPTRKHSKSKGKKTDLEADTIMEEESFSKETEEEESEKDVTDTDDATRDNSKTTSCEDGLAEPEAEAGVEPDLEPEAEVEPEPESEPDAEIEAEKEAEPEIPEMEALESEPPPESIKEVEDDNISVTIQAEDAITLDVDGDDLLETGKHVKLPDSEPDKSCEELEATAEMGQETDSLTEAKEGHKDGKRDDGLMSDAAKKDSREASKKGEMGDKEKDSGKKGPSSTGATGQAKSSSKDRDAKSTKDEKGSDSSNTSSSRNLWVSGLSSNTKAADLKNLFGKYGKVFSAKVVTNARSPGAKCYGLVTMSSSAEVTRCISNLDHTELHGQQISVDRVKTDPFKKDFSKKEGEEKTSSSKISGEKRTPIGAKTSSKTPVSSKKEEKKSEKTSEKDSKDIKKQDSKTNKSDVPSSSLGPDAAKKDEKKHGRKSPGNMMVINKAKGGQNFNKSRPPFRRGGRFEKPGPPIMMNRRPRGFIPPEEMVKCRPMLNKGGNKDILPFEKLKEQRMRERMVRMEHVRRAMELRRRREVAERERRERERIRIMREREERENLIRERQRLEMERQKLERERMERERLERERIRIEQERRKEAERLAREREELRRQQEQLRYEQEKRNNLKRGRDVDQRREDPYWNSGKKMQTGPEGRISQGGDYNNRQQNRFNNFNSRDRNRYQQTSTVQSNNFDRRNRFEGEPESKKSRPAPRREGSGFERFPKNFETVRRAPPPPRTELRDSDRREIRDRDERRPVSMPDRPAGGRVQPPAIAHSRTPRDGSHTGWKTDGGMNSKQGDVRAARMRTERPGREGPGPVLRGVPTASRGRTSFNSRDSGRPVVIGEQQHFGSGRQVVVERHGRDQGPRKEWHGAAGSQSGGFTDSHRMGDSRPGMMAPHSSHSSSGMNRIVQITNVPMAGGSGGFKPFKGRF
ncbi:SAFB-like transcription modulator isoform X2 [Carassius auratus]|uniref:SAFB-like transcription modulator isoform X2 n=1 Tax=Carassius auratus TaxID=7957 RepID=A0A6P6KL88_CARAU|nr:SAFB-like transcription modulator isoform X2 [Carassius auratus]